MTGGARRTPPAPSARTQGVRHPSRRQVACAALLACAAILLALALAGPALFGDGDGGAAYVDYRTFAADVEAGRVQSASIGDTDVTFTLAGEGGTFRTDNPDTPDFKERLLLAGVQVSSRTGAGDVFDMLLNVLIVIMVVGPLGAGVAKLVSMNRSTFKVVRRTGASFEDVAGMDDVKRELSLLVDVLKDPEGYARRGIRPVRGVVLEGPPGNGKTLFARALATEAHVSFIATKGADFQSAFMSLGAAKIRMLFRKAARHRPCIVFIDEFDSIGERRNYAGTGVDKENNRIITAMLNEMDGFEATSGVLVVAATNSYRSLDPALVRPGRFDLTFEVGNPDAATRARLVELYTTRAGRELAADVTRELLVRAFDGLSCAAIEAVLNGAATEAARRVGGDGAQMPITADDVCVAAVRAGVKLAGM